MRVSSFSPLPAESLPHPLISFRSLSFLSRYILVLLLPLKGARVGADSGVKAEKVVRTKVGVGPRRWLGLSR